MGLANRLLKRLVLGLVTLVTLLISGSCAPLVDFRGKDAPHFVAPSASAPRPRLALVLGAGGPRGFAHVGVLKVLEADGIQPDLIVGASVGALIGALSANGHRAAELERLALDLNVFQLLDIDPLAGGKSRGHAIQQFVNRRVNYRPIEQLRSPFAATVTHIATGELRIFNRGDTGVAVRASSANPSGFLPTVIRGEQYMDGDEASPVPIRAARALGARFVIAVDVSAYPERAPADVPQTWLQRDYKRKRMIEAEAPEADVVIHPDLGYYAGINADYRMRCIARAEEATRAALPRIRAVLSGLSAQHN